MARKAALDPEDLRQDLLAALAAGRELGPEMDTSIVDSYLKKHPANAAHAPARTTSAPAVAGSQVPLDAWLRAGVPVMGVAILVVAMVFAPGHAVWLLWPLFGWGFFGFFGFGARGRRHWGRVGYGAGQRGCSWDKTLWPRHEQGERELIGCVDDAHQERTAHRAETVV
jgi:hypothetical protein